MLIIGIAGLALLLLILRNQGGPTASLQQPPWNDRARRLENIRKGRR